MPLRRSSERNIWSTFWYSRFFVLCAVVFLIFILLSIGKVMNRHVQVKNELQVLEEEITQLEQQNVEFDRIIAYMNTDARIERESRLKLGLQKSGESVLVVPLQEASELATQPLPTVSDPQGSNPRNWWKYFFSSETSSTI